MPVPWRCMLKSKACWAAGIANVGHAWGFYTLLTELPTFMDNILHFNMKQVGLFKSKQLTVYLSCLNLYRIASYQLFPIWQCGSSPSYAVPWQIFSSQNKFLESPLFAKYSILLVD